MENEMKKIILLFIIISIMHIYPQVREIESRSYFRQGDIEANISTNLGVGFSTTNSTNTSQNFNYYDSTYYTETYKSEYSDRPFNFLITASLGVCVVDGLSIEPELDINLVTDSEVSISLLGNLTYNFNIPRKNVFPFIKIGYGISNYKSDYYYGYSSGSGESSLDTKVFNAGAGLKIVYSSGMAMKLEINYKHYSYSNSSSYSDNYFQNVYEANTVVDALTLSIGYSILL
jgi:opacity protein-like surface antigen